MGKPKPEKLMEEVEKLIKRVEKNEEILTLLGDAYNESVPPLKTSVWLLETMVFNKKSGGQLNLSMRVKNLEKRLHRRFLVQMYP